MSKHEHTSDEFGKSMSEGYTGPGYNPPDGDPSMFLDGIEEEKRAREGHAPSPFTIGYWKIVVFFVVVFLLGAGVILYLHHIGALHRFVGM